MYFRQKLYVLYVTVFWYVLNEPVYVVCSACETLFLVCSVYQHYPAGTEICCGIGQKIKLSQCRPGQAHGSAGGSGSQDF